MSYIKIDMNGIVVKRCANLKSRFWGGVTEASARKEIEKTAKEVYFETNHQAQLEIQRLKIEHIYIINKVEKSIFNISGWLGN